MRDLDSIDSEIFIKFMFPDSKLRGTKGIRATETAFTQLTNYLVGYSLPKQQDKGVSASIDIPSEKLDGNQISSTRI